MTEAWVNCSFPGKGIEKKKGLNVRICRVGGSQIWAIKDQRVKPKQPSTGRGGGLGGQERSRKRCWKPGREVLGSHMACVAVGVAHSALRTQWTWRKRGGLEERNVTYKGFWKPLWQILRRGVAVRSP